MRWLDRRTAAQRSSPVKIEMNMYYRDIDNIRYHMWIGTTNGKIRNNNSEKKKKILGIYLIKFNVCTNSLIKK